MKTFIVGAASHKHARTLFGGLDDGIALKLEQALLREVRLIHAATAEMRGLHIEQSLEEALLLIVLLEELLREATLLCSQVHQFTVIVLGLEIECQHAPDVVPSRA